jgi:hypothetical protein
MYLPPSFISAPLLGGLFHLVGVSAIPFLARRQGTVNLDFKLQADCGQFSLMGSTFNALCGADSVVPSHINIDGCIANVGGDLQYLNEYVFEQENSEICAKQIRNSGGYSKSCSSCDVDPGTLNLICNCETGLGSFKKSTLNIGLLKCRESATHEANM